MMLKDIKKIPKGYIAKISIGIIICILLVTGSALGASFRLPITVSATGFERFEKPVDVGVNFTQLLSTIGRSGTLDTNTIYMAETNNVGTVLDTSVPFQFDKDLTYNPTTKASGTIVFIMKGVTQASSKRYYYVYFSTTGGSLSPVSVIPQITLTDNVTDEGQSSYRINAINSTYYFQKRAGGFSSWTDKGGKDWISYNSIAGSAGTYRGIPNAVYALGYFHPGFTCCASSIITRGPIKIKIRSITNDGKWETIWDFYPRYATMTMAKANGRYWFLYEGTPGGVLEPSKDFVVRSNGAQNLLGSSWFGDIASNEWAYFSDPTVGRSLFVAHREDDTLQDMYKSLSSPVGSAQMTVLGIGRLESPVSPLISSVPQRFTIGLMDGTGFTQNSKVIYSAYKDLTVTKGAVQIVSSSPSIIVLSPNGGESWLHGTTHTISWSSANNPGSYVKIELMKGTVLNRAITSSTPNDGSYSWTILSTQTLGSDYKIKITSTSNSVYNDWSNNYFRIY